MGLVLLTVRYLLNSPRRHTPAPGAIAKIRVSQRTGITSGIVRKRTFTSASILMEYLNTLRCLAAIRRTLPISLSEARYPFTLTHPRPPATGFTLVPFVCRADDTVRP